MCPEIDIIIWRTLIPCIATRWERRCRGSFPFILSLRFWIPIPPRFCLLALLQLLRGNRCRRWGWFPVQTVTIGRERRGCPRMEFHIPAIQQLYLGGFQDFQDSLEGILSFVPWAPTEDSREVIPCPEWKNPTRGRERRIIDIWICRGNESERRR